MEEKTVHQVFAELAESGASFKFSGRNGCVLVQIDGLMHSFRNL